MEPVIDVQNQNLSQNLQRAYARGVLQSDPTEAASPAHFEDITYRRRAQGSQIYLLSAISIMPVSGLTLADMLATVHPLLTCCMVCLEGEHKFKSFKPLRLVSREISHTVGNAARVGALQLGEMARLSPEHVVRLMSLNQLEHLVVSIITTPGACLNNVMFDVHLR